MGPRKLGELKHTVLVYCQKPRYDLMPQSTGLLKTHYSYFGSFNVSATTYQLWPTVYSLWDYNQGKPNILNQSIPSDPNKRNLTRQLLIQIIQR